MASYIIYEYISSVRIPFLESLAVTNDQNDVFKARRYGTVMYIIHQLHSVERAR